MRASLNTCLQTDSQLNEGVENDVHGQKKKYNFRKNRSISWTQRAQHVDEQIEPLVDGPYIISLFRSVFCSCSSGVYVLSSPRRDKPRVAIKTYAQSEFIITLQHIERLQDAPPMRFDLIEVIFSQR